MLLENSANISHVNRSLYIAPGCPWEGLCHLQLGIKQHWSLSQGNGLRSGYLFGGHPDPCRIPQLRRRLLSFGLCLVVLASASKKLGPSPSHTVPLLLYQFYFHSWIPFPFNSSSSWHLWCFPVV